MKVSFESCALPASSTDVKILYKILRENHVLCRTPLAAWNAVKEVVGPHPMVQYKLALAYNEKRAKAEHISYMKRLHEERQAAWWSGGREAHYLAKYGKFGGDHPFLLSKISQLRGMDAHDVENWDVPSTFVEEDSTPQEKWVKKPKCVSCGSRKCAAEDCGISRLWAAKPIAEWCPPQRSVMLLFKLRFLMRQLRAANTNLAGLYAMERVAAFNKRCNNENVCYPEMEGVRGESLNTISSGNVVLSEENPSAPAIASKPSLELQWQSKCSSEIPTDYTYLTDRWTLCKNFVWDNNTAANTEISNTKLDLPYSLLYSTGDEATFPIMMPFRIFTYFKSDLEIKIHVNSNKFQIGQLQVSWQYLEKYLSDSLDNIYSRSQLPHVVVNAGSSNEATLYIPYKFMYPYMKTHDQKNHVDRLYMGSLRFFVISPLASVDTGPKSCGISVFVRMPNCKFVGMRDAGIIEPQMEAAAAMVAASAISGYMHDRNCDNPNDNSVPKFIVPTGSHSWSLSSGLVEPLHNLRLKGEKPVVNRVQVDMSETSVGIPCRVFGMIKHVTWTAESADRNKYGYQLWSCDAHPQLEKSKFFKKINSSNMDTYAIPPCSVVAGLYKMWRGSLEYRFDIVCSQFHTGRLLVAYIPGFYGDSNKITIEQAKSSPHVEFSLQDASSFTIKVPYIAHTPWWSRKYTGPLKLGEVSAPSRLVMFILNPLVYMESVVNYVNIIPYVRAGDDFEVSVPVQPANGLGITIAQKVPDTDNITPTPGSYPYRVTNYEGFGGDKYCILYEGTAALGTASTFNAPSKKLEKDEYFIGKAKRPTAQPVMKYKTKMSSKGAPIGTETRSNVGYIVLWSTDRGNYGIPFPYSVEGEIYAKMVAKQLKKAEAVEKILPNCYEYIEDDNESSSDFNSLKFIPTFQKIEYKSRPSSLSDCAYPEMEDKIAVNNLLNPTPSLDSTNFGKFNFNENFSDLKDLARRYQLYMEKALTIKTDLDFSNTIAVVPILPRGLTLDINSESGSFNIARDGHIPIISSPYMFFRGSIRFRLIISSSSNCYEGSSIWVQHHPDVSCGSNTVASFYPNIDVEDKFKCHGYGFYVQSLRVNNIIEFEVPFYQPGIYGFNQPLKECKHLEFLETLSLGNILIGLNTSCSTSGVKLDMQLYYSIGDDFSFSCFRGFPLVTFTDEVWPTDVAVPEMEESHPEMMTALVSGISNAVTSLGLTKGIDMAKQGIGKTIKEDISRNVANKLAQALSPEINNLVQNCTQLKKDFRADFKDVIDSAFFLNFTGNLMHVIANPTLKTLAISAANFIINILKTGFSSLQSLIDGFANFLNRHWSKFSKVIVEGVEVVKGVILPEGPDGFDMASATLFSLLFSAVCTIYGVVMSPPKPSGSFLRDISSAASLANNIVNLLRNCGDLIMECINYISGKIFPEHRLNSLLDKDTPEINAWFDECIYLTDSRNKSRYLYDRSMLSRVFDACVVGSLIVSNGIDQRQPAGKLVWDVFRDIKKLQNELCERGAHPDVRFETFPLWFTGPPGIGKSFMTTKLSNDLLKSVNYTAPGSLIYYIAPGAKYWSGVQNPAVLVSDDMFQVSGTRLEEEIANLFMICSSSVLNPPMAAVEDKERRLNPLLYIMHCNYAFPDLGSVSRCKEAVYRRRKFLVEVDLTEEIKEKYPNFVDASQLEDHERACMAHLRFRWALNVKNIQTEYTPWVDYNHMLKAIGDKFQLHYAAEREHFKKRMCDMYCLDPNFDSENLIFQIPELANCTSLKQQIELFRNRINTELMVHLDPFRERGVWDTIREIWDEAEQVPAKIAEVLHNYVLVPMTEYLNRPEGPDVMNTPLLKKSVLQNLIDHATFEFKLMEIGDMKAQDIMRKEAEENIWEPLRETWKAKAELEITNFYLNVSIDNRYATDPWMTRARKYPLEFPESELLVYHTCYIDKFRDAIDVLFDMDFYLSGVPCINELMKTISQFNLTHFEKLRFMFAHHQDIYGLIRFFVSGNLQILKGKPYRCWPSITEWGNFPNNERDAKADIAMMLAHPRKLDDSCARVFINAFCTKYEYEYTGEESIAGIRAHFQCCNVPREGTSDILWHLFILSWLSIEKMCYVENQHICVAKVEANEPLKYCKIRNQLTLKSNNEPFKKCKSITCNWSTDMYHLLLCFQAQSCFNLFGMNPSFNSVSFVRDRKEKCVRTVKEGFIISVKDFFLHTLPKYLLSAAVFIISWLPTILEVSMYALGCKYMYDKIGSVQQPVTVEPQANYFKFDSAKSHVKQPHAVASKVIPNVPQMSLASRTVVADKIERNGVMLHVSWLENGERQLQNCRCLMLGGRYMLVLRHYIEEYSFVAARGFELSCTLVYGNKTNQICKIPIPFSVLIAQIAWACNTDIQLTSNYGIILLPNYVPQFKNIYRLFATQASHQNVSGKVDIYTIAGESSFDLPIEIKRQFKVSSTERTSEVYMDVSYGYTKQKKGLCGSVIVSPTLNGGNGAIIGMHVAGNSSTGQGYAEPLYYEMFHNFFNSVDYIAPVRDIVESKLQPLSEAEFTLDTNLMMYGCVPANMGHKESGKTKILPSLLHNVVYPAVTEVNPLKPNDPRQPPGSHPLRDGCNKHGAGDVYPFNQEDVEIAGASVDDMLFQQVKPLRAEVKPLTMQQAVCGDVDVPYFEPLNWKSSEGFPLTKFRPVTAHDKRWLFDLSEGEFGYQLNGLDRHLDLQLKLRDKCFEENKKPPTIYIDCLKDYRLKPEKCKLPGKTRIFSVAPIQCSLDIRIHCNDFCAALKNSRIKNSIGIGINPDSLEWTILVNYLFEVGDKIVTLDYSNFGPTLMSQLVERSNRSIVSWHAKNKASESHVKRVEWLLDNDILNPVHLASNLVYQTVNGIASGSPLTGECNSIPNLLYIRLAFLLCMRRAGLSDLASMYYFNLYVRIVVYGDDLIMSISDEIIGAFNAITIKTVLGEHGIIVTSAQKDSELQPFGNIHNATFLKRSFKSHPTRPGIWLAPVDLDSVQECINWMHKDNDEQEATLEVCRASLDLAYSHGPDYYESHRNKIIEALNKINLTLVTKTWMDRDREIFGEPQSNLLPKSFAINIPWYFKDIKM